MTECDSQPFLEPRVRAAALAFLVLAGACSKASRSPAAVAAKPPPPTVTASLATREDVPIEIRAIGTVKAHHTVSVRSRVPGELAQALFREGDEIAAGTPIFQIDPRPYQAALEQAQAVLERDRALLVKAQADMSRADELKRDGSISQATYDQRWSDLAARKASVGADESAVRSARLELDYATIHSPITGRAGALLVDVGNVVKENDTVLVTIREIRPIHLVFSVPAQHLARLRERFAQGPVAVDAQVSDPGVPMAHGKLVLIENAIDPATGTIQLEAEIANDDERLWPGQFAETVLTLGTLRDATVVPGQAVQEAQQGSYVFVVKADQTVEQRPVRVGERRADRAVIEEGVAPGEQVVTSGSLRLVAGMTVRVAAPANATARGDAQPTGASSATPASATPLEKKT